MFYHPYILSLGLILFLGGALIGYRRAKSYSSGEKSRHGYFIYPAYFMFVFAMALYYGYERKIALELAGGREAFAATGLLSLHTVSIASSSVLLTLAMLYGLAFRGSIFNNRPGKKEIVHMALGALGVALYTLAVLTGLAMYFKTGLL